MYTVGTRHLSVDDTNKIVSNRTTIGWTDSQQVEIDCGAVGRIGPHPQQHCSFQNETITGVTFRQSIQETLEEITAEHQTELDLIRSRMIQESGANGCRDILDLFARHQIASTYGAMTCRTLQIPANRQSSLDPS